MKYKIRDTAIFIDTRGQSLMEVVVALGVVLFVLISIVVLVLINSFGQKASENRVLATNLAREGVEVFRNLRDTAKLQKKTLTQLDASYDATKHYYYLSLNSTTNVWDLLKSASDIGATWNADTRLYLNSNIYNNSGATYTNFQRRLMIEPICAVSTECLLGITGICQEADGSGQCTSGIIGYKITSVVQWLENNQNISVSLTDFLYDWR